MNLLVAESPCCRAHERLALNCDYFHDVRVCRSCLGMLVTLSFWLAAREDSTKFSTSEIRESVVPSGLVQLEQLYACEVEQ